MFKRREKSENLKKKEDFHQIKMSDNYLLKHILFSLTVNTK